MLSAPICSADTGLGESGGGNGHHLPLVLVQVDDWSEELVQIEAHAKENVVHTQNEAVGMICIRYHSITHLVAHKLCCLCVV